MTKFPEVAYLQTDDFENWRRKMQRMDNEELKHHQQKLQYAIDYQTERGCDTNRLVQMLEACNDQMAVLSLQKPVERELLVNSDGTVPFVLTSREFVVPTVGEVACETCKKTFTIYGVDDDIPDEDLSAVKQVAEKEALKQFTDLHAKLFGHAKSMKIRVKYLPAKKQS